MNCGIKPIAVSVFVALLSTAVFAGELNGARADSLLSVDQNRTEIVEGLVAKWKDHLASGKESDLKKTLMSLRADKLLAVSLAQDQKQFAALLEKDSFLPVKHESPAEAAGQDRVGQAKALGDPNTDVAYVPVTPCRLFYTEIASGGAGGALLPGVTRTFDTRGSLTGQGGAAGCEVPATATAIVLQMGAFSSFGLGWINAGPQGSPIPSGVLMAYNNVAFINATSVVLKLNPANGQFWAFSNNNRTELYGDVLGYFASPGNGNGLRIVPSATGSAPNVINGSSGNQVTTGVRSATIAGGGIVSGEDPNYGAAAPNRVTDSYGTVGGGWGNRAGNDNGVPLDAVGATVAGGLGNVAGGTGAAVLGGSANIASSNYSAIVGGLNNAASGSFATVGGGQQNNASGSMATVSGGNLNQATAQFATVAGGQSNIASGGASVVAGGQANSATASFAAVVGGGGNIASAHGSFIGGGGYCCSGSETDSFPNRVTGRGGSIVGGYQNSVAGAASFIGGGYLNEITGDTSTTYAAAIVGGQGNRANGSATAIGGGVFNVANAPFATVTGGESGLARLYGQTAAAAGSFSAAAGTAQATQYVLRNRTIDATQTELFLDGLSQQLVFEPGRTGLLDIQVIAHREGSGFSAGYKFSCVYTVVVGGAAIQPTGCNKAVVYEGDAAWDANVSFGSGTNVPFGIKVIGVAGQNIRWVATVRATEVSTQ